MRVSTDYQNQIDSNSIETQKRLCTEMCERKGIPVLKIIEQVKSGQKYRQELVDIIEKELKKGDAIVVFSISRFARTQRMTHNLVDTLKKKKCRLLSYCENMDTLEDDKFLGLYAWAAEMESKQISERVKLCMSSKKLRGEHMGNVPFGYKFVEERGSPLEVNPEEQELLQKMRDWRVNERVTYYEISRRLNVSGIPAPKSKKLGGWSLNSVRKLIERDDSKILMLGKRSWYAAHCPQTIEIETTTDIVAEDTTKEETGDLRDPASEQEVPVPTPQEPTASQSAEPVVPNMNLHEKTIVFLRALAMKRKDDLGLNDAEIKELSREELLLLLV